ncbi:hypothetical protein F2Q70_00034698 [Brassica cretica]|uniref:Berberine/berberine-like domain-containing protein n=1 Tax=Brassica cretica TaxID=69181 RepID=A0A8S9JQ52_BRACR|nr:hypothetical protein F2Q70_00034698 [Brassica cretica]
MAEIAEDATPFPHRNMLFKIQYSINWKDSSQDLEKRYLKQAKTLHSFMTGFVSKNPRGAYLNYRDVDIGVNDHGEDSYKEGEVYGRMYFGKNFDRLVKIKTVVDPDNFFRNEQSIPTLPCIEYLIKVIVGELREFLWKSFNLVTVWILRSNQGIFHKFRRERRVTERAMAKLWSGAGGATVVASVLLHVF